MMVATRGKLKIRDFGKFQSQNGFEPYTFKGKVEIIKDKWEEAEWSQDGKCVTHEGEQFFIGTTSHIPTTDEEIRRMDKGEKLERAFFFVEADSFSQFELWKANKYEREDKHKVDWIQDNSGFAQQIGVLYKKKKNKYEPMPVYISLSFAIINGVYVCFYTSDSQVSDWSMVEDFVSKYAGQYDGASRRAMTNASNFHNCIHYCIEPH